MRRALELFMLERGARVRSGARAQLWHIVAVATVCLSGWLIGHFHDRFWWPPDEGNYAHVAERIVDGEVLHADVQDVHPGYVNFANAGALALFGRELKSMRYPLAILGIVQCLLVFLLLRPVGLLAASVGATGITAFGFLQFLNPTAHWYCLFLVILLAAVLHGRPVGARWRLESAGAIVMTVLLFRQLSGVLVAMGLLTYLLVEQTPAREDTGELRAPGSPWLARALIAVMIVGLTGYLLRASDAGGLLLFGAWPLLILVRAGWVTRMPNSAVARMLLRLSSGAVVAAMPLVVYHAVHGSLGPWYHDVVGTALRLPGLAFFAPVSYVDQLVLALQAVGSGEARASINGLFWSAMPFVATAVGLVVLRRWVKPGAGGRTIAPPAVAVLAAFYAVVSVHYQIPIYLTYTAGFSFVALLYLTSGSRALTFAGVAAIAIAVHYHAAQPLSRGVAGTVEGRRTPVVPGAGIPKFGLQVEAGDVTRYGALLTLIDREVAPDGAIFAVPSNAELYFLSGRTNPFRFFNTALGVTSPAELAAVLAKVDREPPTLIFYDRRDKYNTAESRAIMAHVAERYEKLERIGQFEIWRRPVVASVAVATGGRPPSLDK